MGTRSYIGILNADNSVDYVYCHWDGYPFHQLPILMEHYNTAAAVRKLLSKGSMSSLRTDKGWDGEERPLGPLYHIERGDERKKMKADSVYAYEQALNDSWCEFAYLFVPRGRQLSSASRPFASFPQNQSWNHKARTV